jgi:hypothetical protein
MPPELPGGNASYGVVRFAYFVPEREDVQLFVQVLLGASWHAVSPAGRSGREETKMIGLLRHESFGESWMAYM